MGGLFGSTQKEVIVGVDPSLKAKYKQDIEDLKKDIVKLTEERSSLKLDVKGYGEQLKSNIELKKQNSKLNEDSSSCIRALEAIVKSKTQVKGELDSLKEENKVLFVKNKSLRRDNAGLSTSIAEREALLNSLFGQVEKINNDIKIKLAELSKIEIDIKIKHKDHEQYDSILADINSKRMRSLEEIKHIEEFKKGNPIFETLKEDIKRANSERNKLSVNIKEALIELDDLSRLKESKIVEVKTLGKDISSLKNDLSNLTDGVKKQESYIISKKGELESFKQELVNLVSANKGRLLNEKIEKILTSVKNI